MADPPDLMLYGHAVGFPQRYSPPHVRDNAGFQFGRAGPPDDMRPASAFGHHAGTRSSREVSPSRRSPSPAPSAVSSQARPSRGPASRGHAFPLRSPYAPSPPLGAAGRPGAPEHMQARSEVRHKAPARDTSPVRSAPASARRMEEISPNPRAVAFNDPRRPGQKVGVVAFCYPGHNEPCDDLCGAGFLGNFWDLSEGPLRISAPDSNFPAVTFHNSEAAFQALHFWEMAEMFAPLSGYEAFQLKGRFHGKEDPSCGGHGSPWATMLAVLRDKFSSVAMERALLQTGDAFLLHHSSAEGSDEVWSDNCAGDGLNWLGLQLMLIRDELRERTDWRHYIAKHLVLSTGRPSSIGSRDEWQDVVQSACFALEDALAASAARPRLDVQSKRPASPGQKAMSTQPRETLEAAMEESFELPFVSAISPHLGSTMGLSPFRSVPPLPPPSSPPSSAAAPPLPPLTSPQPSAGAFGSIAPVLEASIKGRAAGGAELEKDFYGQRPSSSKNPRTQMDEEIMATFRECFEYAALDGGEVASPAEVVEAACVGLQDLLATSPKLIRVLQRMEQHPRGGITWPELQSYLAEAGCCSEPVPSMVPNMADPLKTRPSHSPASSRGGAKLGAGQAVQVGGLDPASSGGVKLGASFKDQEPSLHPGILALRNWLEKKCGSLPDVAEQIRLLDTAPFDTSVTCTAVARFLSEVQCAAVEDGTLEGIFEYLDPKSLGILDLVHLLGPFQPAANPTDLDVTGGFGVSGLSSLADAAKDERPALAASLRSNMTLAEVEAEFKVGEANAMTMQRLAQDEAEIQAAAADAMLPEDWQTIHVIFYGLKRDSVDEVLARPFLTKVRESHRVRSAALLERIIEMAPGGNGQRTTLAQALDHVESKASQTISWEDFRGLVREAPYQRRSTVDELMSVWLQEAQDRRIDTQDVECDPNEQPELANHWIETTFGVEHAMLRKVFNIFVHCQRGGPVFSQVRRGDFVRVLQNNPSLMASFATTALCSEAFSAQAATPKVWGDVLVHLNCHESDVLTWVDVLEVIRWHCDLCFDPELAAAVGPGGFRCQKGRPGPALPNGKSMRRLSQLITGEEIPTTSQANPALKLTAADVELRQSPTQQMPGSVTTNAQLPRASDGPAAEVGSLFDRALLAEVGASQGAQASLRRPGRHRFFEDESEDGGEAVAEAEECDHAAVADLLMQARRRAGGPSAPSGLPYGAVMPGPTAVDGAWAASRSGPPTAMPAAVGGARAASPSGREAAMRIRVDAGALGLSAEQMERALAEILQLNPSSVRLKKQRY